MAASRLSRLWKDEYFQTAVMILLIVMLVFGFWFGLRVALNTDYPVLAVASGSMSLAQPDDGWSHPFDPSLHTGDLIIVQGVNPSDIHTGPYNSSHPGDIIVFHYQGELIVHRAVGLDSENTSEFVTQGDGNWKLGLGPGPGSPTPPESVVGKVVLRIPWVGNLALLMQNRSGVYLILALIIIIVIVELLISATGSKEGQTEKTSNESNEA